MKLPLPALIPALVMTVGALTPSSAVASTLVMQWGGKYVSSQTPFARDAETSAGALTFPFSLTEQLSPAGPKFYGGASVVHLDGTGSPSFVSSRTGISPGTGGANDTLRFTVQIGTAPIAMYGAIVFKKEDFINGASSQTLTFDAESSVVINVTSSAAGSGSGQTRQGRVMVYAQNQGVWGWYISKEYKSGSGVPQTFTGLDVMDWSLYDPTLTPFEPAPGSSSFNVKGSAFESIEAVGFFFQYSPPSGNQSGNEMTYYVNGFQANLHAIPESGTTAMLVGGGILLAAGRRFFKP